MSLNPAQRQTLSWLLIAAVGWPLAALIRWRYGHSFQLAGRAAKAFEPGAGDVFAQHGEVLAAQRLQGPAGARRQLQRSGHVEHAPLLARRQGIERPAVGVKRGVWHGRRVRSA